VGRRDRRRLFPVSARRNRINELSASPPVSLRSLPTRSCVRRAILPRPSGPTEFPPDGSPFLRYRPSLSSSPLPIPPSFVVRVLHYRVACSRANLFGGVLYPVSTTLCFTIPRSPPPGPASILESHLATLHLATRGLSRTMEGTHRRGIKRGRECKREREAVRESREGRTEDVGNFARERAASPLSRHRRPGHWRIKVPTRQEAKLAASPSPSAS